jgi:hypothetical protein
MEFNLDNILHILVEKLVEANKNYDIVSKTHKLTQFVDERPPLPRSNAWNINKPWLITQHYPLNFYKDDSKEQLYCINFNKQRDAKIIIRRITYWINIIIDIQKLVFTHKKTIDEITKTFPVFNEIHQYTGNNELVSDLQMDLDSGYYDLSLLPSDLDISNPKLFAFKFINAIIAKPINWKLYNIDPQPLLYREPFSFM